jgi:signal transduction histidine kinase
MVTPEWTSSGAVGDGATVAPARPSTRRRRRAGGLLAGMRIRKKLIFLHTGFSLVLAAILWMALRPAIAGVVQQAESHEAMRLLGLVLADPGRWLGAPRVQGGPSPPGAPASLDHLLPEGVQLRTGTAEELGLDRSLAAAARQTPGRSMPGPKSAQSSSAVAYDAGADRFVTVAVRMAEPRQEVVLLYVVMTIALLGMYAFVAAALELFVLPRHVYGPIETVLTADRAVQEGKRESELIAESQMPADELGEIMRSRNASIEALRRHERALAEALGQLEQVATDLKRKNHLLEMAQRNLVDADRLASLGMMSAGIAHELNTPLAVVKGLVEKLNLTQVSRHGGRQGGSAGSGGVGLSAEEAALMLRVVGRLERLSESLLDFARARPPQTRPTPIRAVVDEAWTLVRLDREARDVEMVNAVAETIVAECDPDRIVQVLVNLLRNAVDVMETAPAKGSAEGRKAIPPWRVNVAAEQTRREGREWVSLTITDNGPGIDPQVMGRLFEPFVSTRLDARGTGLGLAVAEGIVREHGGLILARNRTDGSGAVFEVMLPAGGQGEPEPPSDAPLPPIRRGLPDAVD